MYAGKVVESGPMDATITAPGHPYTIGLRNAFPDLQGAGDGNLVPIEGTPPSLADPPPGCRFTPRCPFAMDICGRQPPADEEIDPGHRISCHRAGEREMMRREGSKTETWLTT